MSRLPLVDTHCHLDASRYDDDREAVLARAWEAGLTGVVLPGVSPENWAPLRKMAEADARLVVAYGIHPQVLPQTDARADAEGLELLDAMLSDGHCAAVGECGLDGPSIAAGAPLERQVHVLREHFRLARKHDLPVLVHCLRAHPALVELMKEVPLPERGVLLHSYSGGAELARVYAKMGCFFSLAGPITFLDARKPVDALRVIGLERLMLETDGPDQAPHPHRGTRCEPAHVRLTCSAAARILGHDETLVAEQTTANARAFFRRPFETG